MNAAANRSQARAPRGSGATKRVAVLLTPEDKARLNAIATADSRSEGTMARLLLLKAMEQFEQDANRPSDDPRHGDRRLRDLGPEARRNKDCPDHQRC